ncbi:MAG TPA: O-methyltransferase [Acidimicrobiales bacterium]
MLDENTAAYVVAHSEPADEVYEWLVPLTQATGMGQMQIGPDQGAFLTMLARLAGTANGLEGAANVVEVGTFTGTSAMYLARGLAPGGRLLCCDVSEEWTAIARQAWDRAGVADRIELKIAPAIETLRALPPDATIDLAFVDADKVSYPDYYEELVPRLRPGGLLVADNTLRSGDIVDPTVTDDGAVALRAYNDRAAADDRVHTVLLAVADGLTISQKR